MKRFLNTITNDVRTLPIVILYVTEGCNLRCITCSYRGPLLGELSQEEIRALARDLFRFGLNHIVYSGGEPLLRRDFPDICRIFAGRGIRQTLLTNGLLLEKRCSEILSLFSEIIVSVDGADAETHDRIRGIKSFEQILNGIRLAVASRVSQEISIRTVIQKRNFRQVRDLLTMARDLRVHRISFLAADVVSEAFGRTQNGPVAETGQIQLTMPEVEELRSIVRDMESALTGSGDRGFIPQSIPGLHRIVQYYDALAGGSHFPRNLCNAPMVSAVITSTGKVLPCYFLPPIGDIRQESIAEIMSTKSARLTRASVRAYSLPECHTCTCTLHVRPFAALLGRF